jgi:tetraacyldisaccharide 4'-kinase
VSVEDDLRAWVPTWWRGEAPRWTAALDLVLAPAELIFRLAVAARNGAYDRGVLRSERAPVPVISVGNITVGGAGKTPFAAWLAAQLRLEMGRSPAIVLRGYGADEIAVHRELNPDVSVRANPRRSVAIHEAVAAGADCVVLDDGFQHRSLHRDLDIVLVSAEQWTRRRRMLPRGPWREPVSSLRRAHHVLVTRKSASREDANRIGRSLRESGVGAAAGVVHIAPTTLSRLHGADRSPQPLDRLAGERVVAVTTLADPRPFLAHLRGIGALVEPLVFGDHHEFSNAEVAMIDDRTSRAVGVMTRKEAVKLRGRLRPGGDVFLVEQHVEMEAGGPELADALRRCLGRNR